MRTRISFLMTLLLALCLALAACSSNDGSDAVTSADPAPADAPAVASTDETVPVTDESAQEPTLEDGYPAPEAQSPNPEDSAEGYPSPELASPPPLKTELIATNPSTVNLSSGELQLVEFFAFW